MKKEEEEEEESMEEEESSEEEDDHGDDDDMTDEYGDHVDQVNVGMVSSTLSRATKP